LVLVRRVPTVSLIDHPRAGAGGQSFLDGRGLPPGAQVGLPVLTSTSTVPQYASDLSI
jgi:hypothetical protein